METAESCFVARLRTRPEEMLLVDGRGRVLFKLDDQIPEESVAVPAAKVLKDAGDGSPANRVDVVIVGDGYTASEEDKFVADAAALESAFFGVSPYTEYANFHNVSKLFVPSTESGSDHPPYDEDCSQDDRNCCSDGDALNDPRAGTFVGTAFDGRFCEQGIHRLLVVDNAKVFAAASAVPDWDFVFVLVNDPVYGGSGGTVPVASTHSSAVSVARHEWGHTFGRLADEYEIPFLGYPRCSDIVFGCEANVTDETEPSRIKWSGWIDAGTPIPTPEDQAYASMPGLFEGARYVETGMYRPRLNCLMRSLGSPFCQVCSQEYVRILYGGGWGSPAVGIDPIEPTVGGPNARTPQSSEIGTRGRSSSSSSSSLRGEALD